MTTVIKSSYNITKEVKIQLRIFLPLLLGQLCACAMGTVDVIMAGLSSTVDLSGVALGCTFFWPAFLFLAGSAAAITPITAQLLGANKTDHIYKNFFNGLFYILIISVITTILLLSCIFILKSLSIDKDMVRVATGYIICVGIGLCASAIYNYFRSFIESFGITKPTLIFGIVQLALNIPLNYIFIFGKFNFPALGGIGCGLATCIISIISAIAIVIYVLTSKKFKDALKHDKTLLFDKECIKHFIKLSLPLGVSRTIEVICFTIAALILSPFGPVVVASHSITLNISNMIFNIPLCICMTATIRIASAIGEQNLVKAKTVFYSLCCINLFTFIFYFISLFLFRSELAWIYTNDPKVHELACSLLLLNCVYLLPDAIQTMLSGVLQGFKDSKSILFNTIFSFWIVGIPLGILLAYGLITKELQAHGIWIGFILSLLSSSTIYSLRVLYIFKTHKLPELSKIKL